MARRGFTLVEVLLGMIMAVMVISMTFVNLGGISKAAPARALGQMMQAKFLQARSLAMMGGVPIGVGFAQDRGTGQVDSFYLLQGDLQPRVVQVYQWKHELPGAGLYIGRWALDGGKRWEPLSGVGGTAPLDLTQWSAPRPNDAVVVFTPSGSMVSNLPSFDGEIHLVANAGAVAQAGQSYPTLQQAYNPWTVVVSPSGATSLVQGVASGSSVVTPAQALTLPELPLVGPPSAAHHPTITSILAKPLTHPDMLPAGVDACVRPGGYIQFEARATESTGDVLRCDWNVEAQMGGSFSLAQQTRMDWDASASNWVSRWVFTPPPGMPSGTNVTLNCTISDDRGGWQNKHFGVNGVVRVTSKEILAFTTCADNMSGTLMNLYTMNIDGMERHRLVGNLTGVFDGLHWSPDGTSLTFLYHPVSGSLRNYALWTVNRDGTGLRQLYAPETDGWKMIGAANLSLDGRKVFFCGIGHHDTYIKSVNLDGTNPQLLGTLSGIFGDFLNMDVHPLSGDVMVLLHTGAIWLYHDNGTGTTGTQIATLSRSNSRMIGFNGDGSKIYTQDNGLCQEAPFSYTGSGVTVGSFVDTCGYTGAPPDLPTESPDGHWRFNGVDNNGWQINRHDNWNGTDTNLSPPGVGERGCVCSPL